MQWSKLALDAARTAWFSKRANVEEGKDWLGPILDAALEAQFGDPVVRYYIRGWKVTPQLVYVDRGESWGEK